MAQDVLEQFAVTELVGKLADLWNPNVHHSVHRSLPLDPVLMK
jgi:hypothetical protein